MVVKKVGMVVKRDPRAMSKADELQRWLAAKKVQIIRRESLPPSSRNATEPETPAPSDLFCVFVLGGDGTFLSAVRWIGHHAIPVLGIKFGEVGFLAEITEERLFTVAESILDDTFTTQSRMRLQVNVIRKNQQRTAETVLNDVVINKGALARLASIDTDINDHYLTTYRADGLIVATPTGSTAYSLAAGGPILHPGVPAMVMTPICPFTLTNRPLIIPDTAHITIRLKQGAADMMLTFDGQKGIAINDQDTLVIQKSPYPIQMITVPGLHYVDVLKAKLRWSGSRV